MLQLKSIVKNYRAGDTNVAALTGVSVRFRQSEFVSVLGPSGCGKTTLLNIIGGLDRYDGGELSINGVSTKKFKDSDWDSYRNHSIGFVFQSYNLIPHQSVLSNVELALTLSGVSKADRRRRAREALEKVGLGDQMKKKPNQMSGGQMQRVAIARALVNNPDILLADEPTGALDTHTSLQIMEILREISREKLVIMVTHNPDLAQTFSTRIISLLDGALVGDTNPYSPDSDADPSAAPPMDGKVKKPSMSFFTALSLSLNNLMTKKGRTFMTAFAGSIGIIGIALILSLSSGIQAYIDRVQEDTLSSYPISIEAETVDMTSLMASMMSVHSDETAPERALDRIYSSTMMADMMNTMLAVEVNQNNLTAFKKFLESDDNGLAEAVSAIQYGYDTTLHIYSADTSDGIYQVNPSTVFDQLPGMSGSGSSMNPMMTSSFDTWQEILPGRDGSPVNALLYEQYDVLAGRWPSAFDEVVLMVDENNELNDIYLYSLGVKNADEVETILQTVMKGEPYTAPIEEWSYEEMLALQFKLVLPTDYFQLDAASDTYRDMRDNETYMTYAVGSGLSLRVVGIIRPNEDALSTAMTGAIGYTNALTEYVISSVENSDIVRKQREQPSIDLFTGLPFDDDSMSAPSDAEKTAAVVAHIEALSPSEKASLYRDMLAQPSDSELDAMLAQYMAAYPDRASREAVIMQAYVQSAGIDEATLRQYLAAMTDEEMETAVRSILTEAVRTQYTEQAQQLYGSMTDEEAAAALSALLSTPNAPVDFAALYDAYMPALLSDSSFDENIARLGVADFDSPSSIQIYAASFENKDAIADAINRYNASASETDTITYTDYVALLMSSITTIINAISYVLIAFVAISLVVSSIMIGIITYISVLERTKEIGILRSIGASKRDISRVFNAETLLVGFTSGMLGIGVTLLLCFPINAIIRFLTGINNIGAYLPPLGGLILVLISMLLTFIAGLIPSRIAAKKDPVVALRTE